MNAFDILDYTVLGADTIMKKIYPAGTAAKTQISLSSRRFLTGTEQIYEITGKRKYYDCIKAWVM